MFSCCFQCLFQSDQILYTIVPVTGKENLQQAYIENSEGVCTVCAFQQVRTVTNHPNGF